MNDNPASGRLHPQAQAGDHRISPEHLSELMERSRRMMARFWEHQAKQVSGEEFSLVHLEAIWKAYADLGTRVLCDPIKLAEAQTALWRDSFALWNNLLHNWSDEKVEPIIEPAPGDRRFKDKAWTEEVVFNHILQSYLLMSRWLRSVVDEVEGLDQKSKETVDFYTRQFISAAAPSNFPFTNPQVIRRTQETGGENLVHGLEHLLDDLERGQGRLQISMTDESAFEVGKNVGTAPGKVVFQNDLMQLIQYAPSTETVHRRPLLFIPPWINKFYIMDLQPKNSLIKWTVDQGHTLFVISWVNPRKDLAHKSFEDYMLEGPLAAMDAIERATGETEVNVLGFCIGGILTAAMLAYLAAKGDERIKSATFLASMLDLSDIGEAAVFIDEHQLAAMEQHMAEKGYLEGHHMADMFSMMRENDLIWSFVVNNYLIGREPMPFDMLYWNADSTRLPAAMLLFYLRHLYMQNALMNPDRMALAGVPIDVRRISVPCYSLATREDHIAPWRSCYPIVTMLGGPVRFVLGGSGHIAGVVNPPSKVKYGYWTNAKQPSDPNEWLAGATYQEGSWWPDWGKWLAGKAGSMVPARHPGDGALTPLEDAPGSYVLVRASE